MNWGREVDIAAGPGALGEIQEALDASWSLHDQVPSRVRMEIEIAAAEIAANILEHCCVANFRMELWVLPNEVQVEFMDSGDAVAVDLDSVCMPDEMAERDGAWPMAQAALGLLSDFRDEWATTGSSSARHSPATRIRLKGRCRVGHFGRDSRETQYERIE